jgi:hypothetical protein
MSNLDTNIPLLTDVINPLQAQPATPTPAPAAAPVPTPARTETAAPASVAVPPPIPAAAAAGATNLAAPALRPPAQAFTPVRSSWQEAAPVTRTEEDWAQLEQTLRENVLRQVLTRVDFVLEHRVRDSLADVLQTTVTKLAEEIRGGLHKTLEEVITRAVTQEISKAKSQI